MYFFLANVLFLYLYILELAISHTTSIEQPIIVMLKLLYMDVGKWRITIITHA